MGSQSDLMGRNQLSRKCGNVKRLFFCVREQSHSVFTREGNDLLIIEDFSL